MTSLQPLNNIHHAAYRCRDAEQTRWFYEEVMGLKLAFAFEDTIDFGGGSMGGVRNFLHIFFEMGDGNFLAFFDEPAMASEEKFAHKDSFDMHIALETPNMEELLAWQKRINDSGVTCLGPMDHGFVQSIYMYDPNGIQLEITCRTGETDSEKSQRADYALAKAELQRWTEKTRQTKLNLFGAEAVDQRGG